MANPELTGITLGANSQQASFTSAEIPNIRAGSLLVINGFTPVEITSVTEDGTKKCNLARPWAYGAVTNGVSYIVPTDSSQYEKLKELVTLIQSSNDTHTELLAAIATLATSSGNVTVKDAAGIEHILQGWLSLAAVALTEMQKYGIGKDTGSETFAANDISDTGVYSYSAVCTGRPPNIPTGMIIHMARGTTTTAVRAVQLAIGTDNQMAFCVNTNGVWSNWDDVFTGENLNLNEFGGLAINDVIFKGKAISTTEVRFYIDISSHTAPTDLAQIGTFSINPLSGGAVVTGLSFFDLVTASSNKKAIVRRTGLSGFIKGDDYLVVSESAESKITVEF